MLAMLNILCGAVMNKLHALTRNIDIINYKTYAVFFDRPCKQRFIC